MDEPEFVRELSEANYDVLAASVNDGPFVSIDEAISSLGESRCDAHHLASLAAYADTMLLVQRGPDAASTAYLGFARERLRSTTPRLRDYVSFLEAFGENEGEQRPDRLTLLEYARVALLCLLLLDEDLESAVGTLDRLIQDAPRHPFQQSSTDIFIFLSLSDVPRRMAQIDNACAVLHALFAVAPGTTGWLPTAHRFFAASLLDAYADEIARWDRDALDDGLGFPSVSWFDLFAYTARLLEYTLEADTSTEPPSKCETSSAQYVAWRLGQYVGRFATSPNWKQDPFSRPEAILDPVRPASSFYPQHALESFSQAAFAATALFVEFQSAQQPPETAGRLLDMFLRAPAYAGMSLEQISPVTDLYWAIRLGFLEALLREPDRTTIDHTPPNTLDQLNDKLDRTLLLQVKLSEDMKRRLSHTPRELEDEIHRTCPEVDDFDSQVLEHLIDGEKNRELRRRADARLSYVKAIEAALDERLVDPLCAFMEDKGLARIPMPYSPRRWSTTTTYLQSQLERWTLNDWGELLLTISDPLSQRALRQTSPSFRQFLQDVYHWSKIPDLKALGEMLRQAQRLRGGAAHAAGLTSRRERSLESCQQLRSMALGLGGQESVLTTISRLLRPTSSRTAHPSH